jgi:hypothetical protein
MASSKSFGMQNAAEVTLVALYLGGVAALRTSSMILVGSGSCAAFAWILFVESIDEAGFIELIENPDVDQLNRLCGLCPCVGLADEFKLRLQTLAPGLGLSFLRTRVDKFE